MESQSYQQPPEDNNSSGAIGGGGSGGASRSGFLCRQASSRWIPTTDQIRILRDLYYNCGVRSPNAEQIQRISARLRQYGKIEGKNVFYWFQNHKARERQKKRLTVDIASSTYKSGMLSPGVSPVCTSPGVYCVGQVGANGCSGSVLVERNYMDYSLQAGGLAGGSMMEGNVGWVGVEPAAMSTLYYHQQRLPCFYDQEYIGNHEHHLRRRQPQCEGEGDQAASPPQIETLPLFPIHSSEPQQGEEEDDVADRRNHDLGQQGWIAGKAHPARNGHFPATFYADQPQQLLYQLRPQGEEDQRQYCRAYGDDSSINIGGASLELSLYSYGSGLPRGPASHFS